MSAVVAIRVVFADDHYLVREAVRRLIEVQDDLELCAVCEDRESLLAAIDEHAPDVVVSDIRMPPTRSDEGIQVARQLRRTRPNVGVVVLSQYAEPAYAVALLEGGTAGRAYLLKERISDSEELLDAIREVARGRSVIDADVVSALLAARSRGESPLDRLTPREREVLSHMAQGRNNSAIADILVLTERAVQKHINSIFSKLDLSEEADVHRRVKAVLLFLSDRLEASPG